MKTRLFSTTLSRGNRDTADLFIGNRPTWDKWAVRFIRLSCKDAVALPHLDRLPILLLTPHFFGLIVKLNHSGDSPTPPKKTLK